MSIEEARKQIHESGRVRLTLRMSDEMDALIRSKAEESGMTMNQMILSVLNQWARSLRSSAHTP